MTQSHYFPPSVIDNFIPSSSTSTLITLMTFSAVPGSSPVTPFHEAFDTVRENPQLHKRIHLHHFAQGILKHKTKEQAAPLRPREDVRAGQERLRDAPFKLNAPLMFEIPTNHTQHLPGKIEIRRPRPHNWETHRSSALAKSSTSVIVPWSFSPSRHSNLSHCEPSSPHLVLCSSIAPNSRNPTQCLSCHLNTSSARTPTTESRWEETRWGVRS